MRKFWKWVFGNPKKEAELWELELQQRREIFNVVALGHLHEKQRKRLVDGLVFIQHLHNEMCDINSLYELYTNEIKVMPEDLDIEYFVLRNLIKSLYYHIWGTIEDGRKLTYGGKGTNFEISKQEIKKIRRRIMELIEESNSFSELFILDKDLDMDLVFVDRGFQKISLQLEKFLEPLVEIEA